MMNVHSDGWLFILPYGSDKRFMYGIDLFRMIAGKLVTRYSDVKIRESIPKGESDYVIMVSNYSVDDKRRFNLTSTKYKLREISVRKFKNLILQKCPSFYLEKPEKPKKVFYKLWEELYLVHHYYVVTARKIYPEGYVPNRIRIERFVVIPPLVLMFPRSKSSFSANNSQVQRNEESSLRANGAFVMPSYYKWDGERGKRIISFMCHGCNEDLSYYPFVMPYINNIVMMFPEYNIVEKKTNEEVLIFKPCGNKYIMVKDHAVIFIIKPHIDKNVNYMPLEHFVSMISQCSYIKVAGYPPIKININEFNGYYDVDDNDSVNDFASTLFDALFNSLASSITFRHLAQFLVYSTREKLLTRMCWVKRLKGKVSPVCIGYPSNILLVVDGDVSLLPFGKVNRVKEIVKIWDIINWVKYSKLRGKAMERKNK